MNQSLVCCLFDVYDYFCVVSYFYFAYNFMNVYIDKLSAKKRYKFECKDKEMFICFDEIG